MFFQRVENAKRQALSGWKGSGPVKAVERVREEIVRGGGYEMPPGQEDEKIVEEGILCIHTLQGCSLHHLSFVAVLHHSFTEMTYTSTVVHSTTQNIRSTYVHNRQSKVACVSCPVFVL